MLVCVMCVLMLCSFAGCGNNTGTANDNLNDATSGENYDGSGENGNNTGNNAGDQNGDSILDDAVDDVTDGVDDVTDDITNGVDDAADDLTQENGVQACRTRCRITSDQYAVGRKRNCGIFLKEGETG